MTDQKTAFITGIAGQDGAYLADFLLSRGYRVHGLVRWDSYPDPQEGMARLRAMDLLDGRITIHTGDLTDALSVARIVRDIRPDEIYNLAALSQVGVSFDTPASVMDINIKGTLAILEAVRVLNMQKKIRIYQASSSEMFGTAPAPQSENTPFEPCSPYGVSKLSAYWLARTYRDAYGMFIANGILFNHESPLRGEDFVTRKITRAAVRSEAGETAPLLLGNLDAVRDWGHARDYVRGMWQILNHNIPDDFVLATGCAVSVRDFTDAAFAHVGVRLRWRGCGVDEIAENAKTGRILVRVDPVLYRPKDVQYLLGDSAKARKVLGWAPAHDLYSLIADMVNEERIARRKASAAGVQGEYDSWRRTA